MLAESDAAIIARDPSVSGLELLLDDEALFAALAERLPQFKLLGAHTEYLRYKPGVSCLAQIRLRTQYEESSAYAVAYQRHAQDKLRKAELLHDTGRATPILLDDKSIVVYPFPLDRGLPALRRFTETTSIRDLLRRAAPHLTEVNDIQLTTLRYKPERRFVAQLAGAGRPIAALKMYSPDTYRKARRAAKTVGGMPAMSHAQTIGHADRHATLLFQWIEGPALSEIATDASLAPEAFRHAAQALRSFHGQHTSKLPTESIPTTLHHLRDSAAVIAWIDEESADEVRATCDILAERLLAQQVLRAVPIHGDIHLKQFVVGANGPQLLDFDRARLADPAEDLGTLYADSLRRTINEPGTADFDHLFQLFATEYAAAGGVLEIDRIHLYAALRLIELATEPFRNRHAEWMIQTRRFIEASHRLVGSQSGQATLSKRSADRRNSQPMVVEDQYNLAADEHLSCVREAIQPGIAARRLRELTCSNGKPLGMELNRIRVLRYKPGRRCLIEYHGRQPNSDTSITLLGKVHAKGRHEQSFRRQQSLWNAGFDFQCADGISVAKPVAVVPEWRMWLQTGVPGDVSWRALAGPRAVAVAARIAEAAHKLHRAGIPASRIHTVQHELTILSDRLRRVGQELYDLRHRVERILELCCDLSATIAPVPPVGIHRDFYPDQVLVDGDRLYILDHDLYSSGDPRLDIGNFCGHLMEQSLRFQGHHHEYDGPAAAMIDRFVALNGAGPSCRHAINVFTVLTLARHIYLSRQFPDRLATTEPLIRIVEQFGLSQSVP